MLTALRAITPPQNLPKITPKTKASFCSVFPRHKLCLLIAPSSPRPRNLAGTSKRVDVIGIVAIAAPAAPGLKVPPWPLESTWPIPRLETIVIVAAIGQYVEKIRTWARPPLIIVTRNGILLTSAPSPTSQKTSIGLGDLHVGDWC